MSYNFLLNATKNRIITELRDAFGKHPFFKDLEIYNKFPLEERIQEGIIVRNTTANRFPLAADNFQATVESYVKVAQHKYSPGTSVEWVREDTGHLAEWIYKEDFSHQFTQFPQTNKEIKLNHHFLKGNNDLSFADNMKNVHVYVNNAQVNPILVDGEEKIILLSEAPMANSKVEVSYWIRNLADAGVYQLEITGGDPDIYQYEFMIDPLLERKQFLTKAATGTETFFELTDKPVFEGSLLIKENGTPWVENVDYVFDAFTGIITLLVAPLRNSVLEAIYRVRGTSYGPFTIPSYNQSNNTAIPGVVIAFGRGVAIGDKHFVIVTDERELSAKEYGGKWEMSLSIDIYAKDSHKIEEISDIATSHLLFFRKSDLDAEGIYFVDVSFDGEAEEVYDEVTNDLYYTGSVSYQLMTEWSVHEPLLQVIEGFSITTETIEEPGLVIPGMNTCFEKIK